MNILAGVVFGDESAAFVLHIRGALVAGDGVVGLLLDRKFGSALSCAVFQFAGGEVVGAATVRRYGRAMP